MLYICIHNKQQNNMVQITTTQNELELIQYALMSLRLNGTNSDAMKQQILQLEIKLLNL